LRVDDVERVSNGSYRREQGGVRESEQVCLQQTVIARSGRRSDSFCNVTGSRWDERQFDPDFGSSAGRAVEREAPAKRLDSVN
jgi:hypothetical protein